MSNDYTQILPPVPAGLSVPTGCELIAREYGERCAEAARAPLLAEIDRLTRELAEEKARAVIPDGWVALPVEPSMEILDKGWDIWGTELSSMQPNKLKIAAAMARYAALVKVASSARPEYPPNGLPNKEPADVE